ncbi:uncharacterized protein LOC134229739 [Saccostrea cucullata]|uniref:uncharacterized protein LOC134229739 n=1 Tax=Saccostrea cuccullata TaxID=36930 RepID=UPI002ED0DC7F
MVNRTLISMLGTLDPEQKHNWKKYISPLVQAYNSTIHDSTGYSPYFLMFGRDPILPIDLIFGIDRNQPSKSTSSYIQKLQKNLQNAYQQAQTALKNSQGRQKLYYDTKVRGSTLKEGDRVLIKVVKFDGKHKIQDRWEEHPYIIIGQPNNSVPVFQVKREDDQGRTRILHRNLLLPIGSKLASPVPAPRRKLPGKPRQDRDTETTQNQSDTEDLDSEYCFSTVNHTVPLQHAPAVDQGQNAPTVTGDDQESEEHLEDGSGEDATSQNIDESDDPESSAVDDADDAHDDSAVDDAHDESAADDSDDDLNTTSVNSPELEEDDEEEIPRRSGRIRKKPDWMGDFICKQQVLDWTKKAECFKEMASELKGMDEEMSKVFLKMITEKF